MSEDYSASRAALKKVGEKYRLNAKLAKYRNDPALWVKERLGMHLWSLQREIAESVRDNKKNCIKSCHASGKTQLAAILVCWWIDTHPPQDTRVITTAPTSNQVVKIMWEYIRKLHREHNLRGDVSEAAEWKSEERDVIGMGRKPADTNIHGFQGVHFIYTLVILDEACGIPEQLWTGAEAITTSPTCRILAIGNPDDGATEFGRIFRENDPSWTKFTIRAFDTPNFTEEKWELPHGMSEKLLDEAWVEEKKHTWGVDSARYRAKILAEFPTETVNTFFTPLTLENAIDNGPMLMGTMDAQPTKVLGVDVARFGDDSTVCILNTGGVLSVADSWEKRDTMQTALRVHNLAVELGVTEVRVDASGLGAGVVDRLRQLCSIYYVVIEMVGSASSPDITRWYNARAYIYDFMREGFATGSISLPPSHTKGSPEKQLYEELEGIQYKFMRGAILIESKDEMKRRGVSSPDYADAATYAAAPIDIDDPKMHTNGQDMIIDAWGDEDMARGFMISPV